MKRGLTKGNWIWYTGSLCCFGVNQDYFGSRQQILALAKKKKNKQKISPEGCWLGCTFKGRTGQASKGTRPPRTSVSSTVVICHVSFVCTFLWGFGSFKQVFQVGVDTARNRLISLWHWDQKGKDLISSLRVKDSWEEILIGLGGIIWFSFITRS